MKSFMNINRLWISFRLLTISSGMKGAAYLKKKQAFFSMGENVMIQPRKLPLYPKLIRFGDNVRVASGVSFLTHDVIHKMLNNLPENKGDMFREKIGCIDIGSNVFIGANSTIMYNVKIGNNVIIAAGSVVTKDIPDYSICAGIPVKVIGDYYSFVDKRRKENLFLKSVQYEEANIQHVWEAFYKDSKRKAVKG